MKDVYTVSLIFDQVVLETVAEVCDLHGLSSDCVLVNLKDSGFQADIPELRFDDEPAIYAMRDMTENYVNQAVNWFMAELAVSSCRLTLSLSYVILNGGLVVMNSGVYRSAP
jgi:hypothetical protein